MKKETPQRLPTWLEYLLEVFCDDAFLEEFQGDLEESHSRRVSDRGRFVASIRTTVDVISLLRPRFRRGRDGARERVGWSLARNYANVALRNVARNRSYALLNMVGLAVGLASFVLIGLYIQDELSFDRAHTGAERIYRVTSSETVSGRRMDQASTHVPLVPALQDEFAIVESATRLYPYSALVKSMNGRQFQEDRMLFVDSTFFDLFDFGASNPSALSALDEPFSLVLTRSASARYFGNGPAVGSTLNVGIQQGNFDFTVTAVIDDPPENSHFTFDFLASFGSLRTMASHIYSWYWPPVYSYVALAPGSQPAELEASFDGFREKYLDPQGINRSYSLQALGDIRLRSGLENEIGPTGSMAYVYVLALVAGLILLVGCINYVNLATSRSAGRSREVGMRRVLGARQGQLTQQFLSESILTVGVALVMGLALAWILMPAFNNLTGKSLVFSATLSGGNPVLLLGLILVVGVATGLYPSLYLSSRQPADSLKGGSAGSTSTARLRKGLVVLQFAITSMLIVGTLIVRQQLSYLQTDRLGFDKEHVVVVPLRETDNQINHESLQEEWERLPGVLSVAASSGFPGHLDGLHDFMVWPGEARADSLEMLILTIDYDYAETYGLDIVEGRDFDRNLPTDATSGFLLNESAAAKLGWTEPVGETLELEYWTNRQIRKSGTVLGVVKDFQYASLHRALDPIVFHIIPNSYYNDFLSVRLSPGDIPATLASLREGWMAFNPDRPFEYQFVDEVVDSMYRSDARLGAILSIFAVLAIILACLGLFALAAYTTEQRTREIGVRKIMGASTSNVFLLLSREFLVLVAAAFVVASPLAWLAMDAWLSGFAARISVGVGVFLLSGGFALLFGLLSVGFQAFRAAMANPADSLRHE